MPSVFFVLVFSQFQLRDGTEKKLPMLASNQGSLVFKTTTFPTVPQPWLCGWVQFSLKKLVEFYLFSKIFPQSTTLSQISIFARIGQISNFDAFSNILRFSNQTSILKANLPTITNFPFCLVIFYLVRGTQIQFKFNIL